MKIFLTLFFPFVLHTQSADVVSVHIYVSTPMTCTEAQDYCQKYYTDLFTLHGEKDIRMAQEVAGGAYNQSWFKSLTKVNENTCTLMTDEESRNPVLRVAVCGYPKWLCTSKHPFFCYKNLILVQKNKAWEEALDYCRTHYTDLADLDYKVLPNLSSAETDSVWTGLRFLAGKWFWVGKENIETNISLPSCPRDPYRCGANNVKTGQWENRDCENELNFLCI